MPGTPEKIAAYLTIDWPTNSLTEEEMRSVASGRAKRSLGSLIAQTIVDEAADLWKKQSRVDPSTPYNRSDSDLAINLGYAEVGKVILTAHIKPSDQATDTPQKDPTGMDLLNNRLQEIRRTGKLGPEVIGFERGMERFNASYNQAVRSGIRSDRQGLEDLLKEWIESPFLRVVTGARRVFSGARS